MSADRFQLALAWRTWADAVQHLGPILTAADLDHLTQVYNFAAACHGDQRRPNGDPYVRHLIDVVELLVRAGVKDRSVIAAGILHDVAEDTPCTLTEIEMRFGHDVSDIVTWLTLAPEVPGESREATRSRYFARLEQAPAPAILVKLADRLSNVREIGTYGTPQKREAYYRETVARVLPLSHAHPWFEKQFAAWREAFGYLADGSAAPRSSN